MSKNDPERDLVRANLVRFRDEVELSQQEASDLSGVPVGNLTRYETGKSFPDPIVLRRLAEAYGRPLDDFFLEDPPPVDKDDLPVFYLRRRSVDVPLPREIEEHLQEEMRAANLKAIEEIRKKKRKGKR